MDAAAPGFAAGAAIVGFEATTFGRCSIETAPAVQDEAAEPLAAVVTVQEGRTLAPMLSWARLVPAAA